MIQVFREITLCALFVVVVTAPPAFSQTALPTPKQEKLLNGLKVLMWSDSKADKVSVKIRIHSGSAFDPQGKEGLMQMLADNLFPNEAAREFFTEDLGGGLEIITNYDYIQINASSKPESFLTMIETIATAVSNPAIDKETTAKLRSALLAKVATMEADPSYVADMAVAKRLFGTFPYGRPQLGKADSLKKIEFGDLIDAKNRFLTADNATLAINGNFDKTTGLRAVKRYFGSWLKADKKVPATFRQPDQPDTTELRIEMPDLKNTYSRWAKYAPARNDKDYYSMILFRWIRIEQRCKDTGIYQANLLRGSYKHYRNTAIGELPVSNGNCPSELSPNDKSGAVNDSITHGNFDETKSKLVTSVRKGLSTPSGITDLWLDIDTYKLISPEDEMLKLNGITLADVQTFAKAFSLSPAVKVMVLPPSKSGT
jgi:predicted Zn-dependent peptidase